MIPLVEGVMTKLATYENKPGEYEECPGYWDDLCLANFLLGVCLRYVAYPVSLFRAYWFYLDVLTPDLRIPMPYLIPMKTY